jgi:hypothetical protein
VVRQHPPRNQRIVFIERIHIAPAAGGAMEALGAVDATERQRRKRGNK